MNSSMHKAFSWSKFLDILFWIFIFIDQIFDNMQMYIDR